MISDDELRGRLRAADPAARLTPLSASQVTTLVETAGTLPARRPVAWLVGAAAAVVVLITGIGFALLGSGGDSGDELQAGRGAEGSTAQTTVPSVALTVAAQLGKCMMPNAEFLSGVDVAFQGTVSAVDGDLVTLTPTTTYAGAEAQTVTVSASTNPESPLSFTVGGSYLVAATDGKVVGCGFSGPVTPELQAVYDEAFSMEPTP